MNINDPALYEIYPELRHTWMEDKDTGYEVILRRASLPPMTEAEILAYTPPESPLPPRPTLTAWEGADRDAYWYDNGTWRHCRTNETWKGKK